MTSVTSAPGFDATIAESFTTLLSGGTLAAVHQAEKLGRELVEALNAMEVTVVPFPSSLLKMYEPKEFPVLRKVLTAGEACMMPVADRWAHSAQIRLFNAYGPAENTVCATMHEYRRERELGCEEMSIGRAIPGVAVHLLDDSDKPVPAGVVGEIVCGGKSLSRGYIGAAGDKNRERFVRSCMESDQTVYHTGDYAIRAASGDIFFLGRVDNQVKLHGQMINLQDVEANIMKLAEVDMAYVVVRQEAAGKCLAAFVYPSSVDKEEVKKHLQRELPGYSVPKTIVVTDVENLPKNLSGKIDRKKLETVSLGELKKKKKKSELTRDEVDLALLWLKVLGLDGEHLKSLKPEKTFYDVGGNSLLSVKLQKLIESKFKIKISFPELNSSPSLKEQSKLIQDKKRGKVKPADTREVDEEISQLMGQDAVLDTLVTRKNLLLSGATGFLGAHILSEILQQTKAHVWCMVRAESEEAAMERVEENLQKYDLWQEDFTRRLTPVLSDISKPNLGIQLDQYNRLASIIDTVFMNAAHMDFNTNYHTHRPSNVEGTKEFIDFTTTSKKKFIFSVSSLAVFLFPSEREAECQAGQVEYTEDSPLDDPSKISGGYAQSKWVADKLVAKALKHTAGGAIFRPARIAGQSTSGKAPGDFFAHFLAGTKMLGVKPDLDIPFDVIPVDFCARAMVEILRQVWQDDEKQMPQVFHLFNSDTFPIREMWPELPSQPFQQWKESLRNASEENPLVRSVPFFQSDFWDKAYRWPTFSTANTDKHISPQCKKLLKPTSELMAIYKEYFYSYYGLV